VGCGKCARVCTQGAKRYRHVKKYWSQDISSEFAKRHWRISRNTHCTILWERTLSIICSKYSKMYRLRKVLNSMLLQCHCFTRHFKIYNKHHKLHTMRTMRIRMLTEGNKHYHNQLRHHLISMQ
jgi:ferredoxin